MQNGKKLSQTANGHFTFNRNQQHRHADVAKMPRQMCTSVANSILLVHLGLPKHQILFHLIVLFNT